MDFHSLARQSMGERMRNQFALILLPFLALGFENRESKEDAAAIQVDGFFGFPDPDPPLEADQPFGRIYGYTFLPLAKIAGRDLVASVEASFMNREFRDSGRAVNGALLQGYGVGIGYVTAETEKHKGFAYVLGGINSDMRHLGSKDFYGDMSYAHLFYLSQDLMVGGGFDVHFNLNDYFPYPLLFLDWRIAEHTKAKITFDTSELKQFLSDRFSISLGAQYDLFHYGLGRSGGYLTEIVQAMVRLECRVGENVYLRISAKRPVWGGETVRSTEETKQEIASENGISGRVQLAYGI
jgi:hypothetical protein